MKSRRVTILSLLLSAMLLASPGFANENVPTPRHRTTEPITQAEADRMTRRLEEIKAMDLKSLPRSERRALRKEVREIEQKTQETTYIYVSLGALLLIALLLILLL